MEKSLEVLNLKQGTATNEFLNPSEESVEDVGFQDSVQHGP